MSTYVFLSTWLFLSNLRKELELFSPELSRQLLEVTMSLLSQQTPPPPTYRPLWLSLSCKPPPLSGASLSKWPYTLFSVSLSPC